MRQAYHMETFLTSDRHFLSWYVTDFCNYRCSYCGSITCQKAYDPLNVEQIITALTATGKKWCVGMTGGEPFTCPDFVTICQKLVDAGMLIQIDTNLSLRKPVTDFIHAIPAAMVDNLYISLHIEQREERGEVSQLISHISALRKKGFPFQVNYVLDPRLLHRFEKDVAFFGQQGISLQAKPYRGIYKGKLYPEAYTTEEMALIQQSNPESFLEMLFYSKGVMCSAGQTLIRLWPDGTFSRCAVDKTSTGTLSDGISLNSEPLPCRMPYCSCFGMELISEEELNDVLQNRICRKPPFMIALRRYGGFIKRTLAGKFPKR
jgi:MoaA/NifB/PqqE/SkfB family radical SAM enzyme